MFGGLIKRKRETRSPLKTPPLRTPGQSVQEQIDALVDKFMDHVVVLILVMVMTLTEWTRWFFQSPPSPWLYTVLNAIVAVYVVRKFFITRKALRVLKQARDGEKVIGQDLERLREKGYRVLHDIPGNGFNIDHVVIGPSGVYTIETKTVSKPGKGPCEVEYDGERVVVGGFGPDRDPIIQAKAQANWMRGFVRDTLAKSVEVRPVILYPGWFVKPQPKGVKVWVMHPDRLPGFLRNEKGILDARDIQSIEHCLSMHVRNAAERS